MVRWPGQIKGGQISNEIISHEDWLPTLVSAAGTPDIAAKLKEGFQAGGKTFKVHIDGYDFLLYLTDKAETGPRKAFFAFVDDGSLGAVRYGDHKFHFTTRTHHGMGAWIYGQELRKAPLLIDLRADPFEEGPAQSSFYDEWLPKRMFVFVPLQSLVANYIATYKEFPPRQESGSFTPKQ
jgi:arylsulfatase A-like enzyme